MIPEVSQTIIFLTPYLCSNVAIFRPAAPAPLTTTLQSPTYLHANLTELMKPANAAIDVPC
jgi:hypothetical protein